MAQHIYMKNPSGRYNYRGEAGVGDDPVSFRRLMEARGIAVVIRADAAPGTGRDIDPSLVEESL